MGDGTFTIAPPPLRPIELPTKAEREDLLRIVWQRFPLLSPVQALAFDVARRDPGADNFHTEFNSALLYLAYVQRGPLDLDRSPWWWVEQCREWLRANRPDASTLVGLKAFLTAAVACRVRIGPLGNKPLNSRLPFVELGLRAHSMLAAPSATWRETLAVRSVPEEIYLPNRGIAARR